MLSNDAERLKELVWEIFHIRSHNYCGVTSNRGSKNMPIVWVRKIEAFNEWFISSYQAVWIRTIHQFANFG